MTAAPSPDTRWEPLTIDQVADLFRGAGVRWWLSGGAALEHWLGRPIRERTNIDVSAMAGDVPALLGDLQGLLSAWTDVDGTLVPLADAPAEADLSSVEIHDDERGVWVLRVHGEDGAPKAWLYRRDPRLQLPWDKAVIDVDGVPTGAPAVQLIWKALRPRP